MIIGDFNAIVGSHEKRGGPPPPNISCDEFVAFIDSCDFIHMDIVGAKFKWTNKRKGRSRADIRLDRAICHAAWYTIWTDTTCRTLVREFSGHHLLLLHFYIFFRKYPKSFKFLFC